LVCFALRKDRLKDSSTGRGRTALHAGDHRVKRKGREVTEGDKGYQLREESAPYKILFGAENDDIGPENTYFWDFKDE